MTPLLPGTAQSLFISYRRSESSGLAGRIADRLRLALPNVPIFFDVESIAPGANWRSRIDHELDQLPIMLVIIGARWRADIEDRLPDADDMVRYEVAAGLKRKLRIIPVLIDGARMVGPGELPAELSQLASINAVEVRHSRFDDDVGNLVRAISGHAHLRAYSAGPSYLRIAASALGGALGGIVMIIACLVLQHMITGHALSEHIGADGATLVFAFGPTAGAIAGYALAKQRTWRLRLGMGE